MYRGLTTRQVSKCIFMSVEKTLNLILYEEKRGPLQCFKTAWIQLTVYFRLVCRQQRSKILPQKRRHPPCLSSMSQCGSTADATAVSLDQRPHEHCGSMWLVYLLRSLQAYWLTRLSITRLAREPGSPVAPSVRHTTQFLTFDINNLSLLIRNHIVSKPMCWSLQYL